MVNQSYLKIYLRLLVFTLISPPIWAESALFFTLDLSDETVWQREPVIVTLKVRTDDPFARLEVAEFKQLGFSIIPLRPSVAKLPNEDLSTHQTLIKQWAIFGFIAGKHTLKLPRIRFRPNHGRIQTLNILNPTLQVKILPIYVPPTMSVGEINLNQDWNDGLLMTTHELIHWKISVIGKGVVKQTMPPLIRQVKSTDNYEIFPAKNTRKVTHEYSDKNKSDTIINELSYDIPIKVYQNGVVKLPIITVQYFDPKTGKLNRVQVKPPFIIALNFWIQWLIVSFSFIGLLVLFQLIYQKVRFYFLRHKSYNHVFYILDKASSYADVHQAIKQLSVIKGWGENITMTEFISQWKQDKGINHSLLENYFNTLQKSAFAKKNDHVSISLLARNILKEIKK